MKIYLVTKEKQEAERCGMYKDFYCYLVDFWTFHQQRMRGSIFLTGKKALNFMLRNAK